MKHLAIALLASTLMIACSDEKQDEVKEESKEAMEAMKDAGSEAWKETKEACKS